MNFGVKCWAWSTQSSICSFWDVPRTFAFERAGNVYVLTSEFDHDLDEYPDDYEVFVVSGIGNLSMVSDWKFIEPLPKTSVGRIPVASVRFDESRRKYVDGSFLDTIRRAETKVISLVDGVARI